jgi:hypothetical protein
LKARARTVNPQNAPIPSQRKKAAAEAAAKFREETPRKGWRYRKRDIALQQYGTQTQHRKAENEEKLRQFCEITLSLQCIA